MNNTNENPPTEVNGFSFGSFELNDTNEMCLKTEDFLIILLYFILF